MRTKIFSLLALALICATSVSAKERSQEEIMQIAQTTIWSHASARHKVKMQGQTMKMLRAESTLSIVGYDGGGYAIVTNDDLLPAVVGYSSSAYDDTNENFLWWLHSMLDATQSIIGSGMPAQLLPPDTSRFPARVPQMLTSAWGQMEPFNNMCPLEYNANGGLVGRSVVGCVATAMTQIMYYHQYPHQGTGTYTDVQTTDAFGRPIPIKVDFDDYDFDYTKMRDTYVPGNYTEEEAHEVAELSYAVGVSFAMIYGVSASGTYSDSAEVSLKKHLGFPKAKLMQRGSYSTTDWMNTIFDELSHNRPLMYSGADDLFTLGGGGHAFVFDGYDENGMVHVNWGWYGRNDGYYDVSLLNPRHHSFRNQQDMVIGCEPPSADDTAMEERILSGSITAETLAEIVEQSQTSGLRKVDLSETTIVNGIVPEKAFYGSRLQTIILPSNTTVIGNGAFGNCHLLTEVVFPAANDDQQYRVSDNIIYTRDMKEVIEVLPYYYNYNKVQDDYTSLLTFADGVINIHPYAFDGCFRIKGVVIPATVERIGTRAFAHVTNLKRITTTSATPATAAVDAFATIDVGYTTLAIPAGMSEVYRRAGEWKKFFVLDNIVETGTNICARNVVRYEGEENPVFTYQMFGNYVEGEPVLTCEATASSPVGVYPILVSMGTLSGSDIVLINGTLTILKSDTPKAPGTNAIENVSTAGEAHTIYTIAGQRVIQPLTPGIYIVNGKKRIIK